MLEICNHKTSRFNHMTDERHMIWTESFGNEDLHDISDEMLHKFVTVIINHMFREKLRTTTNKKRNATERHHKQHKSQCLNNNSTLPGMC